MENFKEIYKIQSNASPVSEAILQKYSSKVPAYLIDLWKENGFGKYNDGLIELIHPEEFEAVLWTWLGSEKENYTPIAISGFGELFYYRKLTETEEDVCMIDIQYRTIETLVWSLESFFETFLTDEENRRIWLREELFKEAIGAKGMLAKNEVFTITPALILGGSEDLNGLSKGNAQVYQHIIFEMTK